MHQIVQCGPTRRSLRAAGPGDGGPSLQEEVAGRLPAEDGLGSMLAREPRG